MTDIRAAAQQALEALENAEDQLAKPYSTGATCAITVLRAALAEPVQEPVAWIHTDPDKPRVKFLEWREDEPGYRGCWIKTPLYTAPPDDTALLRQALDSLRGYRREHGHAQPCDAEVALCKRLGETK
jgi:hypothetical protein